MSEAIVLTSANYQEEVVNSKLPVVVDLWGPGCAPCRLVSPILDQLASEFDGRVKVAKVNIAEERELAEAFNVRSVPTIVAVRGLEVVDVTVGFTGEKPLRALFDKLV